MELFEGVRDASHNQQKRATYYGIAVALVRITKAILDDENAVLPLSCLQEGQYGVKNALSVNQLLLVHTLFVSKYPIGDTETQNASICKVQAIMMKHGKPKFKAASKETNQKIPL